MKVVDFHKFHNSQFSWPVLTIQIEKIEKIEKKLVTKIRN
jgi:hypothetical protein